MGEKRETTSRARPPSARIALALGATLLVSLAIAATAASQGGGDPADDTTLGQKIVPGAAFSPDYSQLETGPGEPFTIRQEGIGTAGADRTSRRRSLLYFGQLSDFQLADEESPARVEALDPFANPAPFGSAWRPMEALGAQTTESAIEQVNKLANASPVAAGNGSRSKMDFALTTGDSADNQQRNETQWVVRLLEGGPLDPNSGVNPADHPTSLGCVNPLINAADAPNYTGVQDYDDYFEGPDPAFYDPNHPAGGTFGRWPSYPGLMDRAQRPFTATGLDVPTYVVFGNHDGLMQGNQAANGAIEQVATGCLKPIAYAPIGDPRDLPDFFSNLTPETLTGTLETNPSAIGLVPPDPNRRFVSRPEYKALHKTGASPNAHGFGLVDPAEETASKGSAGYYSFRPKRGFRFIALDTVSEGGVAGPSAEGNIDDPQFKWLERELEKATARDELIFLFSHHAIASLTAGIPDEIAPPCTVPDSHGHDINPGCDLDPRLSLPLHLGSGVGVPPLTGENLQTLVHRFPHVIAWVAGHSHENNVEAFQHPGGVPGGFWSIRTSAEIDWPQQSRLLEVMDNRDGNLSIFGPVIDHSSPVASPAPGTNANAFGVDELSSLSRTFSFNDPQSGGATAAAGGADDRNVELLVRDPRRGR
ncbi:MAG: hypothetical protein WD649_04115 [Thermoleophilaceae bacterium]